MDKDPWEDIDRAPADKRAATPKDIKAKLTVKSISTVPHDDISFVCKFSLNIILNVSIFKNNSYQKIN